MTSKLRLLVISILISLVTNEAMGAITPIRSKMAKASKAHAKPPVYALLPPHRAAEPKLAVAMVEKKDHAAEQKVSKLGVTQVLASRVDDALRQYTSRLALTQEDSIVVKTDSEPEKTTFDAVVAYQQAAPEDNTDSKGDDFKIRALGGSETPQQQQQQRLTTIMVIANGESADTLLEALNATGAFNIPNDFNVTDSADNSTILLDYNSTTLNGTANSTIPSNITANGTIGDSNSTALNETANFNASTPQQQQRLTTIMVVANGESADTLLEALNASGAFNMSNDSTIVLDYNSTALNETANSTILSNITANGTEANSTLNLTTTAVAPSVVEEAIADLATAAQLAGSNVEPVSPVVLGGNSTYVSDSQGANSATAAQIEPDSGDGNVVEPDSGNANVVVSDSGDANAVEPISNTN